MPTPIQTGIIHTACTLDCPDVCSLAVTVADGRMTKIDAAPENPVTDGWICAKVRRHAQRVYAPERVLTPLVRTGTKGSGEFRSTTWGEAMELIGGRIRDAIATKGPDAVVAFTYNSSAARVEKSSLSEAFFAAISATVVDHTICAHTIGEAWSSVFGSMRSADPAEVVHSKLIVVWGANPTVSHTHWPPLVQRAVKAGARLVVIDPRRTAMAARADLHLAIRPGTDVVLALAVANLWAQHGHLDHGFIAANVDGADEFLEAAKEWSVDRAAEVTGLDAAAIQQLARWWAEEPASLLRIGWGPERNANGGAACRAILALSTLIGRFGVPGSGVVGSTSAGGSEPWRRWPATAHNRRARRHVPLHQVGQWLAPDTADPCSVLFVQGANPVVMCPDTNAVVRAFEREDVFTVVHEQVLTDTARYADVVLPATTSFELDDMATGYGNYTVLPVRAVIARVGESRSNDEVGLALANSLGMNWVAPPVADAIVDGGPRIADVPRNQFSTTVPFHASAPHEGRARLVDPDQGVPRYVPIPSDSAHPLRLISPASTKMINSMFGEFQQPSPAIQLSPADAAARGVRDGQQVRVHSPLGDIVVPLEVSADLRDGVAHMTKGVWLRAHEGGLGVNALTPATGDPLGNGACFNDAVVEVTPA
jgi:anaerobic selenocysteine-containing dehydrogenase